MFKNRSFILLALAVLALSMLGLRTKAEGVNDPSVKWVGALRNIHQGVDYSGHIDLKELENLKHLYALGPEAGLKGEITIFDGVPLLAEIANGKLVVRKDYNRKACMLVYGQVANWQQVSMKNSMSSANLEGFVRSIASAHGVDVNQPFAFLVKGLTKKLEMHVLSKNDDLPADGTSGQHERAKVTFAISGKPVEILGFYSEHHQGIFTRKNSSVHLHVRTADDLFAGHVDAFELEPGSTLYLPVLSGSKASK